MQTKKQTIQQVLWILKSGIQQNYFSASGAPIHPLLCTCTVLYCTEAVLYWTAPVLYCTILYCTCTMSCRPGRSRTWGGSGLRTSHRRGPRAAEPADSGTLQHNIHYFIIIPTYTNFSVWTFLAHPIFERCLIKQGIILICWVCVRYLIFASPKHCTSKWWRQ